MTARERELTGQGSHPSMSYRTVLTLAAVSIDPDAPGRAAFPGSLGANR